MMSTEHELTQRVAILEAAFMALQAQIRLLQAGGTASAPLGQRKKPRYDPVVLQALHTHFRHVPEAMDITELTAAEIIETLEANGVRVAHTPHAKSIVIARALTAFGAEPARSQNRRFYRGIVRKHA
jgi:hypothetical protein